MTDAARVGGLVLAAAVLQSTLFASIGVLGGTADVLLVTLLAVGLLRGSVTGAVAGFMGGLLVDVANLGTLGVTALLLTFAGYWAGRYGETTGRDRSHAPLLAVVVLTILVAVAAAALHFMLGEEISWRSALLDQLLPTLGLNLIVAGPIFALCRRVLSPRTAIGRAQEVRVVV